MSELIQNLSKPLANKCKEVITPEEKIYFCIEGARRNAIVGTNKKLVAISAGSFRGSTSYSYSYDNILDIKINPPLHGKYITMDIIAVNEDNEFKPKLYFDPDQKKILSQILNKISTLSNSYIYKEEIKEIRSYQSHVKLVVPMKNVLGKIFDKTVDPEEKIIICVSIGDHQGLVVSDKNIFIFKINEGEDKYKAGKFPLEDISEILYSAGIVTGQLQIVTPTSPVIKKKLREQELLEIDNILSFGKKNYEGVMEVVYQKLKKLVYGNEEEKKEILQEGDVIKESNLKKLSKRRESPVEEKIIEKENKLEKEKIEKKDKKTPARRKTGIIVDSKLEDVAVKLSKEILEEIYTDSQPFIYNREIVKQIAEEVVKHSFPELASSNLIDLVTNKILGSIPGEKVKKKGLNVEESFIEEIDSFSESSDFSSENSQMDIDIDDFLTEDNDIKEERTITSVIEVKLRDFTDLKNVCAALLMDRKTGKVISESLIEDGNYHESFRIANKFLKPNKKLNIFSRTPSQWLVEYEQGLIYLDKLTSKHLLMIVGTKDSNFGTLKLFIEKIKKDLKNNLV